LREPGSIRVHLGEDLAELAFRDLVVEAETAEECTRSRAGEVELVVPGRSDPSEKLNAMVFVGEVLDVFSELVHERLGAPMSVVAIFLPLDPVPMSRRSDAFVDSLVTFGDE
jgi:hypothetical protein